MKNDFMSKTKDYLNELLSSNVPENKDFIVTNNMCEPFNPEASLLLLKNAKCIIVERDPRDIFYSIRSDDKFIPDFEKKYSKSKKSFLGFDNVDHFINRYLSLYKTSENIKSDKVLKINFEDIVLDYEKSKEVIMKFLGLNEKNHINPKKYFDPQKSKKNIGIWKNFTSDKDYKKRIKRLFKINYI